MEHIITPSADGSSTLKTKDFPETYHSSNGACSEAVHIYIRNGLQCLFDKFRNRSIISGNNFSAGILNVPNNMFFPPEPGESGGTIRTEEKCGHIRNDFPDGIRIYDIGLGTALNCLLSLLWQNRTPESPAIHYHAIEKYPFPPDKTGQLNFPRYLAARTGCNEEYLESMFRKIHTSPWEEDVRLAPGFILRKINADITEFAPQPDNAPCIIYYDAFSPAAQPELWDAEIFRKFRNSIPAESILVTYCSKGTVKQALREAGFTVRRLPGGPGKRHMVMAVNSPDREP